MFNNIGSKIKTLAQVVCWLGIVICVIVGIVLMAQDEETVGIGLVVMIFGSLFSWIGSFMTYGFGQLVENSDILVSQNKNTIAHPTPTNDVVLNNSSVHQWRCESCGKMITEDFCPVCNKELIDKMNTLEKWKKDGLITEEEYQQKMENIKNG